MCSHKSISINLFYRIVPGALYLLICIFLFLTSGDLSHLYFGIPPVLVLLAILFSIGIYLATGFLLVLDLIRKSIFIVLISAGAILSCCWLYGSYTTWEQLENATLFSFPSFRFRALSVSLAGLSMLLPVILLLFRKKYLVPKSEFRIWKLVCLTAVFIIFSFFSGFVYAGTTGLRLKKMVRKSPPVGQDVFSFLPQEKDRLKLDPDTSYILFFFSYSCSHCVNTVENLKKYKGTVVEEIIGFNVDDTAGKAEFVANLKPEFRIYDIELKDIVRLTNRFPSHVFISRNKIDRILTGEIPSFLLYKRKYP